MAEKETHSYHSHSAGDLSEFISQTIIDTVTLDGLERHKISAQRLADVERGKR